MNALTKPEAHAVAQPAARAAFDLSPRNFEEAMRLSEHLAASELVPKAYRGRPADCLVAMQWGAELGLKPLQALQSIASINGKPGLYGDAGKALLLASGCILEEDDIALVQTNGCGRCRITRPGRPPVERTFSLDDAKRANLWNKEGPWKTYPFRQMAWRAFWFAARDAAADLLRGLGGAEELADVPPERYMGAAEVIQPAERETYPEAQFAANLESSWRGVLESGRKTPDQLIAMVESKSPLTDDQKARLRACVAPASATASAQGSAPAEAQTATQQ